MDMYSVATSIRVFLLPAVVLPLLLVSASVQAEIADDVVCDKCVDRDDLARNAVTGSRIRNNSISRQKLRKNAVSTSRIRNKAVTTPKIKNGAITTSKIRDGAVSGRKLAPNAVTADSIAAESIDASKIAEEAIDDTRIRNLTRTISIPAMAWNFNPSRVGAPPLLQEATFLGYSLTAGNLGGDSSNLTVFIRRPADYAGGDLLIELGILTRNRSATPAAVELRLQFKGVDEVNALLVAGSEITEEVEIPQSPTLRVYTQAFTIPAAKADAGWWFVMINRGGSGETLDFEIPETVRFVGASIDYEAVQ